MKPLHYLLVLPLAATGFVLAESRPHPNADAEVNKVLQLKADLPLIEALVDQAIVISAEDNPVKRIEHCQQLWERFALEMDLAGRDKNNARRNELSKHLAELTRGMVQKMNRVQKDEKDDMPPSQELMDFGNKMLQLIKPVEIKLKDIATTEADPAMKTVHEAVQQSRSDMEKTVKPKSKKGKASDPLPKGKGKKGKNK
jgi:hypothetical protein